MAFKVNSTTVFDNTGVVPVAQVTFPTTVKGVSVSAYGDGTFPYGGTYAACSSASFNSGTGILTMFWNTNCACVPPPADCAACSACE